MDPKERPLFDHFLANSSTAFKSANAYDPYIYGKKTHRFLTCDVYLGETCYLRRSQSGLWKATIASVREVD